MILDLIVFTIRYISSFTLALALLNILPAFQLDGEFALGQLLALVSRHGPQSPLSTGHTTPSQHYTRRIVKVTSAVVGFVIIGSILLGVAQWVIIGRDVYRIEHCKHTHTKNCKWKKQYTSFSFNWSHMAFCSAPAGYAIHAPIRMCHISHDRISVNPLFPFLWVALSLFLSF